jgi:hypothetical protein
MEKEFVPYGLALRMKVLGFDEPCMSSRDMNNGEGLIQLPLYQQAFRWFREKHGLFATIDGLEERLYYKITQTNEYSKEYNTYEEAELFCLKKLIEIVESKEKEDGK